MKKRNVYLAIIVLIVAIFGVFTLLNFKERASLQGEHEELKIGVILPLTGALAEYGVAVQNGFLLANISEDSKIKFIYEDHQYNPSLAISAYRKLVDIEKVDMIIDWGTSTSETIGPLAAQENVSFYSMSHARVDILGENIVRAWNPLREYARKTMEYSRHENLHNICVLQLQIPFMSIFVEEMNSFIQDQESIKIVDTFTWADNDFRTSLLKIQRNDCDAVAAFVSNDQVVQLLRQAHEMGMKDIRFIGTDFFESQNIINYSGYDLSRSFYINPAVDELFVKKYIEEYGEDVQITYAASGYDTADMFIHNQINPLDLKESLKNISFTGVLGEYTFVEDKGEKYLSQTLVVKSIINGSIQVVKYKA